MTARKPTTAARDADAGPATLHRILLVEDSPTQAERISAVLEGRGYEVELARNGHEGLEKVAANAPDLVLTDVVMPVMDGYALCRAIKASPATRQIPVTLLTSRRTPADIIRGLESGAENFLTKPFEDEYLLERIGRIFEHLAHRRRGNFEMSVTVRVGDKELHLNADKQQIIELLFATSEELADANAHLDRARADVEEYARTLEHRVEERTRQLAEAEARYRSLVENMPAVTYVTAVEEEGKLFYVSPQGELLLGLPSLELLSDPEAFRRHVHEQDRERVVAEKHRCWRDGLPFADEYRLLTFGGATIWVRDEAVPVRDDAGRVSFYQGVLLDVTARKRAEQRLETQYVVTKLLAELPDLEDAISGAVRLVCETLGWHAGAVWEVVESEDRLRCLASWSAPGLEAFEKACRRETLPVAGSLVGRVWTSEESTWVSDVTCAGDFLRREAAAQAGLQTAIAVPIRGSGGVRALLEILCKGLRPRDDALVQMLSSLGQQVGLFMERARSKQAYDEQRMLFQSILDSTPAVISVKDSEGRYRLVNRRLEDLLGTARASILEKTDYDFFPHAAAARYRENDAEVLRNGVPVELEEEIHQEDGVHTYRSLKFPLLDGGGSRHAVCSISTDVTHDKRAQLELLRQKEHLAQAEKLAAMGSLLAGVAHELNNPLSVVIGQTSLLARSLGGAAAERTARIAHAAERCARTVRNFLGLARQRPTEKRRTSLRQVVEEALELVAYPLRVDSVELVVDVPEDLPEVWADPHQLHQVIVNLVTNAHHALKERPPPRRMAITAARAPGSKQVVLDVEDTGPGVPPEVRARIFEPFFTTKPPGVGTGLGLSLCRGIVEAHGGTLSLADGAAGGALFRIGLPLGEPAERPDLPPPPPPAAPRQSGRVLVVDDEEPLRALIAEWLESEGYQVVTAADGARALDVLAEQRVDLVLSDLRMPELDGPGLYRETTRRHPELARRFVFLSGDSLGQETMTFLDEAACPTLEKPFTLEHALEVVTAALARSVGSGGPT